MVLTAGGHRGENVRAWNAQTGSVVAEWGAGGEQLTRGGGGGSYRDHNHNHDHDHDDHEYLYEHRDCVMYPGTKVYGGRSGGAVAGEAEDTAAARATAATWGAGFDGGAFGACSFAVGTSAGTVRVYGPEHA
jgi:hypothetical protein